MKKVFLVGIGGIGVSALAKFLFKENYEIFGSDLDLNENVIELKKKFNLNFFDEKDISVLEKNNFEFLIYTAAVNPKKHKIIQLALKKNIPIYTYFEFLGKISEDKFLIAVAGTNGKTTTTTMLVESLDFLNLKPTAIVGGIMRKFNSNFLASRSDLLILESCEYKNSFLNLKPNIIIITNITSEHLDFFGNFENVKKAFINFVDNLKEGGILICNTNDHNLKEVVKEAQKKNIKIINYTIFLENLNLKIAGKYNLENAAAVLAVISVLETNIAVKLNLAKAKKYLEEEFLGPKRRLEFIGKTKNGAEIYDDYAHNPESINLLIIGLRKKYPRKKIILIFQPHLYSRTKDFQNEFVEALIEADEVYLLPIYGAREKKDQEISSEILAQKLNKKQKIILNNIKESKKSQKQDNDFLSVYICKNFLNCEKKIIEKKYDEKSFIITVGAGDVYKIGKNLIEK